MDLKPPSPAATRDQLLAAAADVFAEQGFRAATVREICRRAGANVAAVNYHFRDKDALYAAVLGQSLDAALRRFPPTLDVPARAPAETRLEAFVRSFLHRVFDLDPSARHARLMLREMIEPTGALDGVVAGHIAPLAAVLLDILRALLGPRTPADTLRLAMNSVVAQVLFYAHCRPVLERLQPGVPFGPEAVPALAAHITRFSLAGVAAVRPAAGRRPARRQPPRPR